eukprot:2572367-Amphidinium_carterae.1
MFHDLVDKGSPMKQGALCLASFSMCVLRTCPGVVSKHCTVFTGVHVTLWNCLLTCHCNKELRKIAMSMCVARGYIFYPVD